MSNNCRWANCTPNCDFRGVQRVLMENFRVRWGPVTTILFVDLTAEMEMGLISHEQNHFVIVVHELNH